MKKTKYRIKEKVWIWGYDEVAPWHFVNVPKKETAEIQKNFGKNARGWRSLRVLAKTGKSEWKTSIFLDSRTQTYLLPIKAKIRKAECIMAGDTINYSIEILLARS